MGAWRSGLTQFSSKRLKELSGQFQKLVSLPFTRYFLDVRSDGACRAQNGGTGRNICSVEELNPGHLTCDLNISLPECHTTLSGSRYQYCTKTCCFHVMGASIHPSPSPLNHSWVFNDNISNKRVMLHSLMDGKFVMHDVGNVLQSLTNHRI